MKIRSSLHLEMTSAHLYLIICKILCVYFLQDNFKRLPPQILKNQVVYNFRHRLKPRKFPRSTIKSVPDYQKTKHTPWSFNTKTKLEIVLSIPWAFFPRVGSATKTAGPARFYTASDLNIYVNHVNSGSTAFSGSDEEKNLINAVF